MDIEKKQALVEWIRVMVSDAEILNLADIKENSTILFQLLKQVEVDLRYSVGTNEKNIVWVCQYLRDMFNSDVLDEDQIQVGNELEIGKMLCLILELTLTSSDNSESISRIQSLPEDVQTNIMSMTKMVCDNCQKFNLGDIMDRKLKISVTDEGTSTLSDDPSPINPEDISMQGVHASTPVAASSHLSRLSLNTSMGENTSPLATFASSPQAFCRRVMIENKKLRQKVRHSELFSRRRTEFEEQLSHDVEFEKRENEKLLKEQDQLLQKIKDHDDNIIKLKEEIEFLQLETQSKDQELQMKSEDLKKSNELLGELQNAIDRCTELEGDCKQKQLQLDEEVRKVSSLTTQNNELKEELEQQRHCAEEEQKQHQILKYTFDTKQSEMEKMKKDYLDQVAELQERLTKQEKQTLSVAKNAETLSEALKNDTELLELKERCKKLQNDVNAQQSTLINMGHESKKMEAENQNLQAEVKNVTQKFEESSENYKKQSNQYMDQISSLLKQVEEHSQKNEGLNTKISSTEQNYKLLERKLEKYEECENKINEQIQQQSHSISEKDNKITILQKELDASKKAITENDVVRTQLEVKLQVLNEEQKRLLGIEKQHQHNLSENERLRGLNSANEQKMAEQMESLKTEYEKLSSEHNSTISQLRKENDSVKQKLESASEEIERLRATKKEFESLSLKYDDLVKVEENYRELQKQNESLRSFEMQFRQATTEVTILKSTLDDCKKSMMSSESNQKSLINDITELREVKLKYERLLLDEIRLKESSETLQLKLERKTEEVVKMKELNETLETEMEGIKSTLKQMQGEHAKTIQALKSELESLRDQLTHSEEVKGQIEENLKLKETELSASMSSSKNENELLKESLTRSENELVVQERTLKEVKDQLKLSQASQSNYSDLQAEYEKLRETMVTLEQNNAVSKKNYEEKMTQELKEMQDKLANIQANYDVLEDEKIQVEVRLEQIKQESIHRSESDKNEFERVRQELEDKYETLLNRHEEVNAQLLEGEKKNKQLQTQHEELIQEHQQQEQNYEKQHKQLQAQYDELQQQPDKALILEKTEAKLVQCEQEFEEKLKMREETFEMEREKSNEIINGLTREVGKWKELTAKREEESRGFESVNLECLEEMKSKDLLIEQLKEKFMMAQKEQKRSAATMRSLEAQLKSSEDVIRNLKKEIKESVKDSSDSLSKCERQRQQQQQQPSTSTTSEPSDEDACSLKLSHLESDEFKATKYENKAEEIFQRSRSTRSKLRRSLIVVREDTTDDDSKDEFSREYSLRSKSERRRSFQPRRYMGGRTPPNRRTLIGDPMQVQMSTFNTETAEEPEIDYDWDRIQTLKESDIESSATEEDRLRELQRRNTLCLPHLRSSYPMELRVDEKANIAENCIRDPHAGNKRKVDAGPKGTYKKCKTESSMAVPADMINIYRSTRSASILDTTRGIKSEAISEQQQNPLSSTKKISKSCAFEITMEPAKNTRPRLARAVASGNLRSKPTTEPKQQEKSTPAERSSSKQTPIKQPKKQPVTTKSKKDTVNVENQKDTPPLTRSRSGGSLKSNSSNRFNRGEGVRNSFKSATQRVAASFRGKKPKK